MTKLGTKFCRADVALEYQGKDSQMYDHCMLGQRISLNWSLSRLQGSGMPNICYPVIRSTSTYLKLCKRRVKSVNSMT